MFEKLKVVKEDNILIKKRTNGKSATKVLQPWTF